MPISPGGQQGDALRCLLPHQRRCPVSNSLPRPAPGVMAGPWVKSAVPEATRQFRTPGHRRRPAMPMSTGTTSHRAVRAIWQTLVSPGGKILRHGAGHALVRLADAPRHHAVVRAEDEDGTLGEIQRRAPGEGGRRIPAWFSSAPSPPSGFARLAQWA